MLVRVLRRSCARHAHRRLLSVSSGGGVYSAAIIGSGPSAFYTAKYLLEHYGNEMRIDIYERLPLPFGLVRYGVAPDHQDVKACIPQFEQIAGDSRVRFYGGIEVVGGDFDASSNEEERRPTNAVRLSTLRKKYSLVVLAYGAGADQQLPLPTNETFGPTNNVVSAREFVSWYNGHPHYPSFLKDNDIDLHGIRDVVIVGNGNVAIDIARILTKDVDSLEAFDMTADVLSILRKSSVRNVHIVGRRGHCQASFTIKEFRELTKLPNVKVAVNAPELSQGMTVGSAAELAASRPKARIAELVQRTADEGAADVGDSDTKRIHFRFLLSPVGIQLSSSGKVEAISLGRNVLAGPPHGQSIVSSGEVFDIKCGLVIASIGYKCLPLYRAADTENFFDSKRNVISHTKGKVVFGTKADSCDNVFAVGWCKRGPSGIIGTNVTDAKETVATIIAEITSGTIKKSLDFDQDKNGTYLESILLNANKVFSWEDYKRINREEVAEGKALGKIREKRVNIV